MPLQRIFPLQGFFISIMNICFRESVFAGVDTMKKSNMKKLAMVSMAAIVAAMVAGCGGGADKGAAKSGGTNAKIALITATTGGAAAYGEAIKNGAELAVEQINKKANENKNIGIDLVVEDTKGDKNEAINAMNKVIHKDNVLAVMGPMLSGEMFAAGPVANRSKIVALGTSTTAEGITDIGPYIFRNAIPESIAVEDAIIKAHEVLGFKTAAIMYSNNNDQMVSVNKTAEAALKKLGVQVVDTETFADKDTDYSAQLTKVQQAKPDVIIVASLYQEGILIMKKMREMGMNQKVVGSNGFNSPAFIQGAGAAADGAIVGTPWFPNKEEQNVKDFRQAYKSKYGKEPDQFAAQAYDGIYLMYEAIVKSGSTTDREKFKTALQALEGFVGVTGKIAFDAARNPKSEVQVLEVKNGEYVPLSK